MRETGRWGERGRDRERETVRGSDQHVYEKGGKKGKELRETDDEANEENPVTGS